MAQKVVLTYFRGRGKGESIRMMLALAGVEFTHAPFLKTADQMKKLREDGKLLFQQVPLVEWDGKNMVQTLAIIRHIARKYGFDGKTEDEKLQVDILSEGAQDFRLYFGNYGFVSNEEALKDVKQHALPRYMPVFEKILTESKSGFLVGDSITVADIRVYDVLTNIPERCPEAFDEYPQVKQFYDKISAIPQIAKYMNGPQRLGPNDEQYVTDVKTALGW